MIHYLFTLYVSIAGKEDVAQEVVPRIQTRREEDLEASKANQHIYIANQ